MIDYSKIPAIESQPRTATEVPCEFCAIFDNISPSDAIYLYRTFKWWVSNHMSEVYRSFAREIENNREKARQSIEASPIHLPNACKGKPYKYFFRIPDKIKHVNFSDISELGLRFERSGNDSQLWRLIGSPKKAGEFYINYEYTWENWSPPYPKNNAQLKLIINPDPRDLWKNIATDLGIEYYKKDSASSIQKDNYEILLGASIRGRSHAHKGLPRDDDFLLGVDEETNWRILAVADGAGSAQFSRKGSAIATDTAVSSCARILAESPELNDLFKDFAFDVNSDDILQKAKKAIYKILPQAALEAYKAIREEAQSKMRDPKEYATTLLLAIAKKFADNWVVISFQVGDGAMAIIYENDGKLEAKLLAEPDEGEFGGQTRFITMQDIYEYDNLMKRIDINVIKNFKALLLMTDGVSDPKFTSSAELHDSQKWLELWQELKQIIYGDDAPNKLLKWLEFWSPGNHDDRTIAILA